MTGQEKGDLLI